MPTAGSSKKRPRSEKSNMLPFSISSRGSDSDDSFDAKPRSRGRPKTSQVEVTPRAYKPKSTRAPVESESEGEEDMLMQRKLFDDWMEKKLTKLSNKREKVLEDKLKRMSEERDQVQVQFDELRQLRHTAPEKALEEVKKTAETRHRHDKEMINSLKAKAEAAERRAREAESNSGSVADRSMSIVGLRATSVTSTAADDTDKKHKREMAEAVKLQRKLEEQVKHYKHKLEEEIATSTKLLEKAHLNGSVSAPKEKTCSAYANEEETAIRRLYEDLTGIVIRNVKMMDPKEKLRSYSAYFAHKDHHALHMDLEESRSEVEDDDGNLVWRDELVYFPQIDDDRDREMLETGELQEFWKESLRFDREMAFRFYGRMRAGVPRK